MEDMERLIVMPKLFGGVFENKRILVTGHTGFKGSWLSVWLVELEAHVAGYSLYVPSNPSHFESVNLKRRVKDIKGDIRDRNQLKKVFDDFLPEIVFHLAAQPITRLSYDIPQETFYTNLGGTVNILDCIRESKSVKAAVIITSDKCYRNVEWNWGYRENDRLGGDDPYSASKACAEIASYAYIKSFFSGKYSPRIATTRAGNVIGGGDWAQDRIIPDCVRTWSRKEKTIVRNPKATRPWQHVLEPLSGYLWLGANLVSKKDGVAGEAFNFGPDAKIAKSVGELIDLFLKFWGNGRWEYLPSKNIKKEAMLLKLSCDKALHRLGWHSILNFDESVKLTATWYKRYYSRNDNMYDFTCSQIKYYIKKAIEQNMPWVRATEIK